MVSAAIAAGQVPPEVDQTLRARVNQFFQYHVEGGASLRKAMEMVADETKDVYFASGKLQVVKYQIKEVEYNGDFTQAKVSLDVSRNVVFVGQVSEVTQTMPTTWKIEDGKWMWYLDKSILQNSMTDVPMVGTATATPGAPPPDLSKPESVAALAESILRPSSVDKQSVSLRWGQASEDTVVFLNSHPGVELELGGWPDVPGLSIVVDKATLQAKENGALHFRYTPPAGLDATKQRPPEPFLVPLRIIPFNEVFRIQVIFSKP